jgi:CheY-like chemotaxis protein
MTSCVCVLEGSLDDFSIPDVLQVISLGRKTGHLSLETPTGGAAIVFRNGRILASIDDQAPPLEASLAPLAEDRRDERIRESITASIERLSRSRQGEFSFQASDQPPQVIEGRSIAAETLRSGIDVIDLLLEVAYRQEESGRATPAVLLVDDEEPVRRLLSRYLVEGGYRVVEAGDVETAVKRAASLGRAGVHFVLVADLNMPAALGNSFRGGYEVVKRLARLRLWPPVVMMADGASSSHRAMRAREEWSVVRKPVLSKLDPAEFEADLRALAARIVREVLPRVCGAVPA